MKYISLFSIVLLLILLQARGFSQKTYSVSGKVTDKETGETLIGANITIKGTKIGAITNMNGVFEIKNINETNISLRVAYLGYEPQEKIMQLTSGKNFIRVRLQPSSEALEEVVVTEKAEGATKAMIEQKDAVTIKNVVAREQIELFPDMNAAEAMQRIPGITLQRDQGDGKYIQLRGTPPEYTNFNVNGSQIPSPEGDIRHVGMDIISADQIEFIEISKVLTPDMDGDAIAGSVNIITKTVQSETPEIKATIAGGYNNLRGTGNGNLQFSFGQRKNKFGFQVDGSYYQNNQGADNLEFDYVKGPFWSDTTSGVDNIHMQYTEMQLRYYKTRRERTGLSSTMDYQFNKNHKVYIRGMYNEYVDQEDRRRRTYEFEDALNLNNYLYGSISHDVKNRTKTQKVNTLNMGSEHTIGILDIDAEVSYALAKEDEPDRIEATFENPGQALQFQIDRQNPEWPKINYPVEEHKEIANNFEEYEFDDLELQNSLVEDKNLEFKSNFQINYELNPWNKGYFKFGTKIRFKDKTRDIDTKAYSAYNNEFPFSPVQDHGPELTLTSVSDGLITDNLLDQGYIIEHIPNAEKMKDFYDLYPHLFIYGDAGSAETKIKTYANDYEAEEDIYAAYLMFQHEINNLMVVGGLRYELTRINYEVGRAKQLWEANGYIDTLYKFIDKRDHPFILPSFQIKYKFSETLNIRGAITTSFSRPKFEDVLPIYVESDKDKIKMGNPDLNYPFAVNADLLVEKYLKGNGILAGGIYYKRIDNPIFLYRIKRKPFSDINSTATIQYSMNGLDAFVYGGEFQAQYKFSFLPGVLENFGIYTNYSYTVSEARMHERPVNKYYPEPVNLYAQNLEDSLVDKSNIEKIVLPGQSMHALNLAIFYESAKLYMKLSANYHDKFLLSLGGDADMDEYQLEAWHLDFNATYQISSALKLFTDIVNLTNTPQTVYRGSTDFIQKQEYYSWWGRVGIKLSF